MSRKCNRPNNDQFAKQKRTTKPNSENLLRNMDKRTNLRTRKGNLEQVFENMIRDV